VKGKGSGRKLEEKEILDDATAIAKRTAGKVETKRENS